MPGAGAVVSDDHASPSLHTAALLQSPSPSPVRLIPISEVKGNDGTNARPFHCVIDGMVVDATGFVNAHPGGLRKILSADDASVGATGKAFGFSFSTGRNAHFPGTGTTWSSGVSRYLKGSVDKDGTLQSHQVEFKEYGSITILGKLNV